MQRLHEFLGLLNARKGAWQGGGEKRAFWAFLRVEVGMIQHWPHQVMAQEDLAACRSPDGEGMLKFKVQGARVRGSRMAMLGVGSPRHGIKQRWSQKVTTNSKGQRENVS